MSACDEGDGIYRLEQLSELSLTRHGEEGAELTYRPMSESLYYSPGIQWTVSDTGIEVRFVRCGLKQACATDYAARRAANGVLSVQVPNPTLPVHVSDGSAKRELSVGK